MKTATITNFRKNMKNHLESVENDQDVLILSGSKKRDYVVLTLEYFNAMQETAHLLSNPANTAHLLESIEQDKTGNVFFKNIPDVKSLSPHSKTSAKRIGRAKRAIVKRKK
jgi:antitoxin YefM